MDILEEKILYGKINKLYIYILLKKINISYSIISHDLPATHESIPSFSP